MRKNLTFRAGEPFWANACVGSNGEPDYYNYAKGFSEAANLLIKSALSENGCQYPVDTFIYPICFNMRHSVELRLKGAVECLAAIAELRDPLPNYNLEGSHDIGRIWDYFKLGAAKVDSRIDLYTFILDDYILDIAEVDATGQTFRYPYNILNEKHLMEIDNINIRLLYDRFKSLELFLDSLNNFMLELKGEYNLGTYTKKLGRPQILDIAMQLPDKEHWGKAEFKLLKDKLKSKYLIGSKELSLAVEKIFSLYRSENSGIPSPDIKHLDISDLKELTGSWIKLNAYGYQEPSKNIKIESKNCLDSIPIDFKRMKHRAANLGQVVEDLAKGLDANKVSDIHAIYESGDCSYPEIYPFLVNLYQRQYHEETSYHDREIKTSLSRLMRKPDFLDKMLKCLFLIGHRSKAEAIISEFNLEGSIKWLAEARAEEFFVLPCNGILASCVETYVWTLVESRSNQFEHKE
ncbi:hypothetical protein [Vreelandella sp. V005]|uniref:hypothetical protein n=1 Tax=Vreelandella sp. V005 TaxID=3459608 RepID=UPI004043EECD